MAIHKHSSWGRTRRPKHLSLGSPASKQTAKSVTPVGAGALADDLDSGTAANNGYATENQRFLHIQIENDGTGDTLEIYVYNYAFGAWAKYYLPHGTRTQLDTGDGDDSSGQTTNDSYVTAKWTTINGKFMVSIPIHGIDRVAFVHDGSLGNMVVRAACSTF